MSAFDPKRTLAAFQPDPFRVLGCAGTCVVAALGGGHETTRLHWFTDKAEIALEYPDKLYVGTFESSSRFEAHLDATGIALILERPGVYDVHKSIHMHIHFGLFADILRDLASTVAPVFRGKMSCIGNSSRKQSLSYMRR